MTNNIEYQIYNTGSRCNCEACNDNREDRYALCEKIAKEIESQCLYSENLTEGNRCTILDWVDDSPIRICTHAKDAEIARSWVKKYEEEIQAIVKKLR